LSAAAATIAAAEPGRGPRPRGDTNGDAGSGARACSPDVRKSAHVPAGASSALCGAAAGGCQAVRVVEGSVLGAYPYSAPLKTTGAPVHGHAVTSHHGRALRASVTGERHGRASRRSVCCAEQWGHRPTAHNHDGGCVDLHISCTSHVGCVCARGGAESLCSESTARGAPSVLHGRRAGPVFVRVAGHGWPGSCAYVRIHAQ
jgi:hypothetical protein